MVEGTVGGRLWYCLPRTHTFHRAHVVWNESAWLEEDVQECRSRNVDAVHSGCQQRSRIFLVLKLGRFLGGYLSLLMARMIRKIPSSFRSFAHNHVRRLPSPDFLAFLVSIPTSHLCVFLIRITLDS